MERHTRHLPHPQFNKIEQFIFCKPEDSPNSENFWGMLRNPAKLGLAYQVVNVCTGDIGTVAAKNTI
jgi:seryl-tRNA synthetase